MFHSLITFYCYISVSNIIFHHNILQRNSDTHVRGSTYHCTRARTRPSISPLDVTQFVILERALSLSESSTGSLSPPVGSPPADFNFEPSSPDDISMSPKDSHLGESPMLSDMPRFFANRRRRGISESDSDTLTKVCNLTSDNKRSTNECIY